MLSPERNKVLTEVSAGTPMGEMIRRYWVPAVLSEEVEANGRPIRLRLLGEDLVAFRDDAGKVGILESLCPHRKAPLYFGRNENGGLTCIYHGWKFSTTGECLQMPNVPKETRFCDRVHIRWYPTQELNGIVWTYMGPREEMPDALPPLDFVHVPENYRLITKQRIDANWAQVLEGDFDPSHISFLHGKEEAYREFMNRDSDIPADDDVPEPEDGKLTGELERYYWRREPWPKLAVMQTPYGMFSGARRDAGPNTHYYRFNQFILPFFAGPPGEHDEPQQCNIWVPMDDRTTIVWRVSYNLDHPLTQDELDVLLGGHGAHVPPDGYRDPDGTPESRWVPKLGRDNDYGIDFDDNPHGYFAGIVGIWAQDRACTEGMGAILDRSTERLVSSDAAVSMVRRILLRTAQSLAEDGTSPPSQDTFPTTAAIPNMLTARTANWEQISADMYERQSGQSIEARA
ncbi:Rieske 2Fe-2S domain-containing protein [Mycolicibacterium litorale]|uniref:Rieske 2Fe-2S domain-containing protein n=1 Tax=Mycolicibacterium litorale TaxID=758802 RepID=UPI003CF5E5E6